MNVHVFRAAGLTAMLLLAASACPALAGGFVELDGDFDGNPASPAFSALITNLWWPLPEGAEFIYTAEEDGECIVSVMEVLGRSGVGEEYKLTVDGTEVRTVRDEEVIDYDDDCDGLGDTELLERTLDWYAQDVDGNIWYFGEHTVALGEDEEECDVWTVADPVWGLEGCLDGSWEAGADVADVGSIAEEGIIMLTEPEKGLFYFQEYYEDVATDMGKVLNFKDVDVTVEIAFNPVLDEELEGCAVIKEWVPLEPGNVEHKYYCYGYGLMQVEGNAGGPTVWTDLIWTNLPLPLF
jgi:hypothetical protein